MGNDRSVACLYARNRYDGSAGPGRRYRSQRSGRTRGTDREVGRQETPSPAHGEQATFLYVTCRCTHRTRVETLEAKRRADEEQQRHFEEEPIDLPPDLAEYQSSSPASAIEDETHSPVGELHTVEVKEEEPASDPPEPPLEDSDSEGELPEELQLAEPLESLPEPEGRVYPQPTAISLNEA
jgi:hypothetical protein